MVEGSRAECAGRPPPVLTAATLTLLAAFALQGCASWVQGQAEAVPGADQAFPRLSSVPDRPRPSSTPEQRQAVTEGLIMDRDRARDTNEALRRRSPPPAAEPEATPRPGPTSALGVIAACDVPRGRAERCFDL